METLFLKLVNLSLSAGWLVLAVLVLRLVFRRAPRWIFCLLWGLVALRLACPFSIESALSLLPSAQVVPTETVGITAPVVHTGIPAVNAAVNPILADRCTVIQFPAANAQRIQSIARKYAGKKMQDKLYQLIRLDEGLMDRYIEDLASHRVTSIRKHQQMIETALEQALGLALEQESDEIVPVSAEMFAQAEQKVLGTARRRTGF